MQYVYLFIAIGAIILIIASVNFVNLSTAKSLDRAKEVGMRKISGAGRGQLVFQFLSESILINVLSVILAIIMVSLLYPFFNQITGELLNYSFI